MENITNRKNLSLLVQLRWLAVAGQIVTIFVVHFGFEIDLPLTRMAGVLLFLIALNLVSFLRHRRQSQVANSELFIELLLDVAALTVQLYFSGGASNPFISLYLLQVILGAALLDGWSVWLLVVVTGCCFVWLTSNYRPIIIPHAHGDALFDLHMQGMFICFVLAASLLVVFVGRIQRNLEIRDAHLAELRQHASEEDLIVRMGLLASGAAHELGTPLATLSVILGDWRGLRIFSSDRELSQEMKVMQDQIDRCKSIVSGMLLSAGDARAEGTVRTTAAAFLDETVDDWRSSRLPPRIDYHRGGDLAVPIVSDRALKQVVFNLLDNALDASADWIGLTASRDGEDLVVTIDDDGPGFSPEMLAGIGKPYQSSKGQPGGGLGLFLVTNVVRKLGGVVVARNRAGGGASIRLSLPLSSLAV